MNSWQQVYQKWNTFQNLDVSLKAELADLQMNTQALEDAFYKELTFGTGGMRGILGPGINRMNIYTVRKAVNGLANYLLADRVNVKDRGVVIAYDSRHMSKEFAVEAAKVLGYYGIHTHVFDSLRPTPLLSFAVRYLGSAAGVMITASHNPPEYNGFKVYNETGAQIIPEEAEKIIDAINETADELSVPYLELEQLVARRLITWSGKEIDNAYLEQLAEITRMDKVTLNQEKELKIVYTPLHGTGLELVTRGLEQLHFPNVHVVAEQAVPDPDFSTVESPNPEEHQAFSRAITLGKQVDADILLGTDPDADRLGVAVKTKDKEYQVLTGNQLGSLLLDYILKRNDPVIYRNARMIKTVVTTELGRAIADSYNVETIDTLTGFKYIGEKIHQFTSTGETFVFGYEESYGYLINSFVREKDAVQASVMAAEMASYWQQQGKTLFDALEEIYEKHGYYLEGLSSLTLKGKEGQLQIMNIMETVREQAFKEIAGFKVEKVEDYLTGKRTAVEKEIVEEMNLPRENMMKFILEQNAWVCLRPSGTEPKIKCYFGVRGNSSEDSEQKLTALKEKMEEVISGMIH